MPSTLSPKFLQSTSPKVKLKALCDLSLKYHGLGFLSRGLRILKVITLKDPGGSEGGRPVTPNPILLLLRWEKEKTCRVMLFHGAGALPGRPMPGGVLGCRINGRSIGGTCTGARFPGKNHAAQWVGRESLQFHVKCKEIYIFKSKVWVKCNYWIHLNISPHNIIKLHFFFSDTEKYFYLHPIIHQSASAILASYVPCFVLF